MKTLKDLVDAAIQQEKNAQALYRNGADIVEDQETKQFLNKLAKEEVEHEKMLFNIKDNELFDLDVPLKNEAVIDDTKSSHGDDDRTFEKDLSIEAVFEIALKREFQAQQVYKAAADSVAHDELKQLFLSIAAEEENHHKIIERQYAMFKGEMGNELG